MSLLGEEGVYWQLVAEARNAPKHPCKCIGKPSRTGIQTQMPIMLKLRNLTEGMTFSPNFIEVL